MFVIISVVGCRIKVTQEKVAEEVSKSDAEDETRSIGQQSIVESHNSLTRDHDGETNKVKLKACPVVMKDIFKVSRCAEKTNRSEESATGNDLQTCCSSTTNISPQKVGEHGQISENIDREELTEFTVKLPDMGDCTYSSEGNENHTERCASRGSSNPKINPPRRVIVVVKPGTIGSEETTRFVVKLCDTRDCTYNNGANENYLKENETGNPSLPDVNAEQTMCSPTSVETLPAIDKLDSPLNSRASRGSNNPKISPPKKVIVVVNPEPENVDRQETTEFTDKLCQTRKCSHSDDANEEFYTVNDTADPGLPDVDAENCEQQTMCSPTSEEAIAATKEFDCLPESNASRGSNNPNISAPRKVIVVVKPGNIGRGESYGFTVKLCDTINDSHSDKANKEHCTEDYDLADDEADKYEDKTVCSSTTVETHAAANEHDIKTDHNYVVSHQRSSTSLETHAATNEHDIKTDHNYDGSYQQAKSNKRSHRCDTCGKSFRRKHILKRHTLVHTGEKTHRCPICGKLFGSKEDKRRHIVMQICVRTRVRKSIFCSVCGKSYIKPDALKSHELTHSQVKPFACATCSKAFVSVARLKAHMHCHTGVKRNVTCVKKHLCSTCGKMFATSNNRKKHNIVHTGEKPYSCKMCDKSYGCVASLKYHELTHTGKKTYVCETCGKYFLCISSLNFHKRYHHSVKPFHCSVCDKSFIARSLLKDHEAIHTGKKDHVCVTCGKSFRRASGLAGHKLVHSDTRPYMCETCGKAFKKAQNLKLHTRTHTGEKPYTCSVCGTSFAAASALEVHKRIHANVKPYTCTVCGKSFVTRSQITTHEKSHSGEKPHACTICGKRFTLPHHRRAHEKTHGVVRK